MQVHPRHGVSCHSFEWLLHHCRSRGVLHCHPPLLMSLLALRVQVHAVLLPSLLWGEAAHRVLMRC